MNPSVVKHILLPLHERLVGRDTLGRLAELERTQWLAPDDLRELQVRKLRRLLKHAWDHVPYYRRQLAELNFKPSDVTALDVLHRLPLLTKSIIKSHRSELRWPNVPGGLQTYNTGGSTGEPLIFEFDLQRQAYDQAARLRAHRWFDVDVGDKQLYVWGSPVELGRQDRLKTLRDRLTNHLLLSAFEMSPERMDAYLDRIERYRPVSLFGYPSSLALLAEHGRRRGRRLSLPALRAAFVTGERLYDHQREGIAGYFGVPVADCYGSREGGFIAHECPAGSMHITSENIVLEVLDAAGRPAPTGEVGRIVVTHLDALGMPFIRYDTGDMGRLATATCRCGRGLGCMAMVEGRQTDFVVVPDGTIKHALSLIYVLRELEAVRQFQIVQGEHLDLDVHVMAEGGMTSPLRERIEAGLRKQMGPDVAIRIHETDHIEPAASGKYRYVISHAALPRN